MTRRDDFERALTAWSPPVRRRLDRIGCLDDVLESRPKDADAREGHDLMLLAQEDAAPLAAKLWAEHLDDQISLGTSELILVLEHLRHHPAECAGALRHTPSRVFSRTLANVAFRVADAAYEDAKGLLYRGDVDRAMARFDVSLDEFRFAIESQQLTPPTMRLSYGKYATAVAFSGRWSRLSPEVLNRALRYSEESLALGNQDVSTIVYRIELLLQAFDVSNDTGFLFRARELSRTHPDLSHGTEMAQAEVRLRLALSSEHSDIRAKYLENARRMLDMAVPVGHFDVVRKVVLTTLLNRIESGFSPPPSAVGIPDGLVAALLANKDAETTAAVVDLVDALEDLWKPDGLVSAAVTSARLLRGLNRAATGSMPAQGARYVEVTAWIARIPGMDRHLLWEAASAAMEWARATGNSRPAWSSHDRFTELIDRYPRWPLPRIGRAKAIEVLRTLTRTDRRHLEDVASAWRKAAELAIAAPDYRETSLGGRNSVFAIEDARGFMSDAFVFKPMSPERAEFEAKTLGVVSHAITERGLDEHYAAPASLAVVPWDGVQPDGVVHVVQRAQGAEIGSLGPREKAIVLRRALELLSIFHEATDPPQPGRTAWKLLKANLKLCLRSLTTPADSDEIVAVLKDLLPKDLPLVMKRDAHGGNWLQDDMGRIVAIDMESSGYLPVGHDVAQLIEDSAMLPIDADNWTRRFREWRAYQERLGLALDESVSRSTYEWFALYRAIWLCSSPAATRMQRTHGRELCEWLLASSESGLKEVARTISQLSAHSSVRDRPVGPPPRDYQRISRQLSYVLRHQGPSLGVDVDEEGFARADALAAHIGVPVQQLIAVVEHPAEPRFQHVDGMVRALYGHSLPATIDHLLPTEEPSILYHGSTWGHLEGILNFGIRPMKRQKVHLSSSVTDAMDVGNRHGAAIVFEVPLTTKVEAKPVAEGVWVTGPVPPEVLALVNPYSS